MNSKQCHDQEHLFATTEPLLIRALCLGEKNSSVYFCRVDNLKEVAEIRLEHTHCSLSKNWGDDEVSMPLALVDVVVASRTENKSIITLFSDDDTKVSFQLACLTQSPQHIELPSWLLDQIVIGLSCRSEAEYGHEASYQHLVDSYLNNPHARDGEGISSAPSIQRIAQTLLTLRRLHRYNGVDDTFDPHFRDVLDLIEQCCDNYRGYDISQDELYSELSDLRELFI
ncbi:hypothetical protein [Pseudoalteromonas rubra]|uniref:hypothetical protein n=1 Tax=Pseudoalteromonas rubra TaxID=43658 RepID=UPI000F79CC78|nr:hypothetical protein [Pseudoalteromonas rubra]